MMMLVFSSHQDWADFDLPIDIDRQDFVLGIWNVSRYALVLPNFDFNLVYPVIRIVDVSLMHFFLLRHLLCCLFWS